MTPTDVILPDLTGQRAVVTGGDDGVGLVVARRLAAAGAEVVLPVRDPRRGEAAVAAVRAHVPGAAVSLRTLDLSCIESVLHLCAALRAENQPIGILVNTAVVAAPRERRMSGNGYELQLGANHLGHFALVARLLPLLRAGGARVTSQISAAARWGGINWVDPNWDRFYNGRRAHAQSVIALGLFGMELDRRSRVHGWGITSTLAHPGSAARRILGGTPETAARPVLHAATSPGGLSHGPGGAWTPFPGLRDVEDAQRMWQLSEELSGVSTAAYESVPAHRS